MKIKKYKATTSVARQSYGGRTYEEVIEIVTTSSGNFERVISSRLYDEDNPSETKEYPVSRRWVRIK